MSLVEKVQELAEDPASSGWVPQPGFEQLRDFLITMQERGLVIKRPYDLPLPDYSGVKLSSRRREQLEDR